MPRDGKRGRKGKWYKFTREDCQKGYRAAKAKCDRDWDLSAWFYRRIRGYFRAKGTWYPQTKGESDGPEEDGPASADGGEPAAEP